MINPNLIEGAAASAASSFNNKFGGNQTTADVRPTVCPEGAEYVNTYDGSGQVSIKEICEEFCINEFGKTQFDVGSRHHNLFTLVQMLTGWLGGDVKTLQWNLRDVAVGYPDYMTDVENACGKKYRYMTITKGLKSVLEKYKVLRPYTSSTASSSSASATSQQNQATTTTATTAAAAGTANTSTAAVPSVETQAPELLSVGGSGELPAEVVQALPRCIRNCLNCLPSFMGSAFLTCLWPVLSMFCKCRVQESDGPIAKPTMFTALVGEPASGKSRIFSFIRQTFLHSIDSSDDQEREKLAKWVESKQQANSSQTVAAKPRIKPRIISKVSSNQLLSYIAENNKSNDSMLLWTDEVSGLVNHAKQSYGDISEILRTSYGGDKISVDSLSFVSDNISTPIHLNCCVAGQLPYVMQWIGDINDGSASRYDIAYTHQDLTAVPHFSTLPDDQQKELDDVLQKMSQVPANTIMRLPRTTKALLQWRADIAKEIEESVKLGMGLDKARWTLSVRAQMNGLRAASLIYLMNGCKESAACEKIGLWVAEQALRNLYTLVSDKLNCGNQLIQQLKINETKYTSSNVKLLSLIPEEFTVADVQNALTQLGRKAEISNAKTQITDLIKVRAVRHSTKKGVWTKVKTTN